MNIKINNNFEQFVQDYIINEIFVDKIYDFSSPVNNPIIIDCGANVGFSIAFFKHKYPESSIYAFEADTDTYSFLIDNILNNGLENIFAENIIVSNTSDESDFYILNNDAIKIPVMSLFSNMLADVKVKRPSLCFGEYVRGFDYVDFCKVDIEGAESFILQSLIEFDSLTKVNEYVFEYHSWVNQFFSKEDFITIFESFNYECRIIKEEPPIENISISGNSILNFKRKLL